MNWNELKEIIDAHENTYPDLNWQKPVFEMLAAEFSVIPIECGVYQGTTEAEIEAEKRIRDLKAPLKGFTNWQQYSYTPRHIVPEGDKIGIVTGPASGLLVLDVDDLDAFKKFCGRHGIDMEMHTLIVQTREGRYHLYFRYPDDGREYRCRSHKKGKDSEGIDVRGARGFVEGPGSIHPMTRKPYKIISAEPIAEAPEWLKNWSLYRSVTPPPDSAGNIYQVPAQLNSSPIQSTANLSNEIQTMIGTAYPQGERSEPLMSVILSMLNAGMPPDQVSALVMGSEIGNVARQKGQAWLNYNIANAQQYIARFPAMPPPKKPKLNMSHELFQTMCQFQYYFHKDTVTYYAKMTTDDGKGVFYEIDSDAFEGKIIALQEAQTVTSGSYYDFQKAKKKLASYVAEHAIEIRSLTRFGKYGDAYTLYLARGNGETVMITKTGYVIDQHPEALQNTMDDMFPIEDIDLGCNGLTATNALFDVLGITDPITRDFFIIWLICNLFDDIEKPFIVLIGKEGSGKTTLAMVLKQVWDCVADKESGGLNPPDNKTEFAIELSKQGVLHIDNVTAFSKTQQNLLCQAFNNGYVAVKKLYSSGQNIRFPLSCNVIITALDIPSNMQRDFESRAVVYALPERNQFAAKSCIMERVKSLLPAVRGELCSMASKMMACTHEYKPISMNRWSDFDVKGQLFYDVLGHADPVKDYTCLLKELLRRKARLGAKTDSTLSAFISFVEEWKLLVFTMTELYEPESCIIVTKIRLFIFGQRNS